MSINFREANPCRPASIPAAAREGDPRRTARDACRTAASARGAGPAGPTQKWATHRERRPNTAWALDGCRAWAEVRLLQVRKLHPADQQVAGAFLERDPVAGGLIHSLILRHGWRGGTAYCGLWDCLGHGAGLEGLVSLDDRGRSTLCGGGLPWVEHVGALLQSWLDGDPARLRYFDAPAEMAGGLARAAPPVTSTHLAILACDRDTALAAPTECLRPQGLAIREAAASDAAALTALYRDEAGFAWVDVPVTLAMCRDGHRLWLVGLKEDEIVTSGWGNTLEPAAARLSGIMTRPDQRGRGYAATLTAELTRRLAQQGRTPYLYVAAADRAANALYDRLGYRLHSQRVGLSYGGDP